jgi:hypothetical protein
MPIVQRRFEELEHAVRGTNTTAVHATCSPPFVDNCADYGPASVRNKRKHCNAAGRLATYSTLPFLPSANFIQLVPEEVRAKLYSEALLKYQPSFWGLKSSVQVAPETDR